MRDKGILAHSFSKIEKVVSDCRKHCCFKLKPQRKLTAENKGVFQQLGRTILGT